MYDKDYFFNSVIIVKGEYIQNMINFLNEKRKPKVIFQYNTLPNGNGLSLVNFDKKLAKNNIEYLHNLQKDLPKQILENYDNLLSSLEFYRYLLTTYKVSDIDDVKISYLFKENELSIFIKGSKVPFLLNCRELINSNTVFDYYEVCHRDGLVEYTIHDHYTYDERRDHARLFRVPIFSTAITKLNKEDFLLTITKVFYSENQYTEHLSKENSILRFMEISRSLKEVIVKHGRYKSVLDFQINFTKLKPNDWLDLEKLDYFYKLLSDMRYENYPFLTDGQLADYKDFINSIITTIEQLDDDKVFDTLVYLNIWLDEEVGLLWA